MVTDGGRGDPGEILLELEGAGGDVVVVVEGKVEGEDEGEEGDGERSPLLDTVAVGQQSQDDGSCEGRKVMIVRMLWSMFIVSFSTKADPYGMTSKRPSATRVSGRRS